MSRRRHNNESGVRALRKARRILREGKYNDKTLYPQVSEAVLGEFELRRQSEMSGGEGNESPDGWTFEAFKGSVGRGPFGIERRRS